MVSSGAEASGFMIDSFDRYVAVYGNKNNCGL